MAGPTAVLRHVAYFSDEPKGTPRLYRSKRAAKTHSYVHRCDTHGCDALKAASLYAQHVAVQCSTTHAVNLRKVSVQLRRVVEVEVRHAGPGTHVAAVVLSVHVHVKRIAVVKRHAAKVAAAGGSEESSMMSEIARNS